jgi:hypothetical protein
VDGYSQGGRIKDMPFEDVVRERRAKHVDVTPQHKYV